MTILWRELRHSIMELVHILKPERHWAKTTVITMLNRLEAKGAVAYEQGEKARRYFALVSQEEAVRQETEIFLDKVYGGSLGVMMSTLVQQGISEEERRELLDILQKAEERL